MVSTSDPHPVLRACTSAAAVVMRLPRAAPSRLLALVVVGGLVLQLAASPSAAGSGAGPETVHATVAASLAVTDVPVELTPGDVETGDEFGWDVAVSGDTALVTAKRDTYLGDAEAGSAYVFTHDGAGTWTERTKLVPTDPASGKRFGSSGDLDGDTAVVGAPWNGASRPAGSPTPGAAYVFNRVGGTWSPDARLGHPSIGDNDLFGYSVAIDGDTVAVGAPHDADPASAGGASVNRAGSVFVFVRNAGTWMFQQQLVASDREMLDRFGRALDLSGDVLVVGAPNEDDQGPEAGKVYVFTRSGGVWTEDAQILAPSGTSRDRFGRSVALENDTMFVGAPTDGPDFATGSVFAYEHDGDTFGLVDTLTADDGAPGDRFGRAVTVDGDFALVGAVGAAASYLFKRETDGGWSQDARLGPPGVSADDQYGGDVALDGETAVVGAPGRNSGAGAAFFVTLVEEDAVCPESRVPRGVFQDVDPANLFAAAIDCIAWWTITRGITATMYGPDQDVSRGQIAGFLARTGRTTGRSLDGSGDAFIDDDTSVHEDDIDALAAVDVLRGQDGLHYGPLRSLRRDQMASMLVRMLEFLTGEPLTTTRDWFTDDEGNVHEENINKARESGLTSGRTETTYAPTEFVKRAQMAQFIVNFLERLVAAGLAQAPSS